jgi:hypothetical protein
MNPRKRKKLADYHISNHFLNNATIVIIETPQIKPTKNQSENRFFLMASFKESAQNIA